MGQEGTSEFKSTNQQINKSLNTNESVSDGEDDKADGIFGIGFGQQV